MAKETLSVTIDSELLKKFKEHCKEIPTKRSMLIEKIIRDYMKENGNKK